MGYGLAAATQSFWVLGVVFLHIAFRPFFPPLWRAVAGAVVLAFFYGVVGAMLTGDPAGAVPPRVLIGFVYGGIGLAACEGMSWLLRRRAA